MEKIWFFNFVSVFLVYCFMTCLSMTQTNLTTDQSALLSLKAHITFDPHNVLTHNWSTVTSCCNWIGVTCGVRHNRVIGLNLPNVGLTGTIPPHLGNLSFLTIFNIENNTFHGHLPKELAFFRRLKVIDLGLNHFSGEVPLWLGSLPKLQRLRLFNNSFSGSLPEDLCSRLPELQKLSIYQNQFHGQIPSGLHKCRQLQQLALSFNKFTGSIPREIGNLTMLKELHLAKNILQGVIPDEMGDLISLEILNMRDNYLTGPIPLTVFNISSLKKLDLENNSLSGPIPSGLWRCRDLTYLSLSMNTFTAGSIPREIVNLTSIKGLYLAFDNLTEYGSEGVVSTRGDMYSFGILLMETFTRKKPTDEMFVEEMSLKHWVKESLPYAVIKVVDANMLRREDKQFTAKMDCTSSILELALECCAKLPEERTEIKDVVATLHNIRSQFHMSVAGTQKIHDR